MAPPASTAYQDNPWTALVHAFVQLLIACLVLLTAAVSLLTAKLVQYFGVPYPYSALGLQHYERSRLCELHRRLAIDQTCVECLRAEQDGSQVLPLYRTEETNRYVKQLSDRDREEVGDAQDKLPGEDQRFNDKDEAEPKSFRHGPTTGDRCVKRKFAKVFVDTDRDEFKDGKGEGDGEFSMDAQPPAGEHAAEISVESVKAAFQAEKDALGSLYAELEEERNASAIAANEAMAMITRLQEEKAAVQMEARQYQRMVEEKAVYDQEAITLLKEILFKREQEKFVLEKEVESYRRTLLTRDDWSDEAGEEDQVPLSLTFRSREDAGLRGTNLLDNFETAWSPRPQDKEGESADERSPLENEAAAESGKDDDGADKVVEDIDLRTTSMLIRDKFRLAMEEDIRELTSRLQVLEDDRKVMKQIVHSIKAEKRELRELLRAADSRVKENESPKVSQAKKRRMEQDLAGGSLKQKS